MKRNLKKAMAFAMATATLVANLGVAMPVAAAEYTGAEKILDTEYEIMGDLGDGICFGSYVEEKNKEGLPTTYLDEIIVVDKNGETSSLEVKNTDGEYKYRDISWVTSDCVALIQPDESYVLLREDGSYFGGGEEKYDDMFPLDDGNYIVTSATECKVVDKTGAVIAEDIFEPVSYEYISWGPCSVFNEYIVLGRYVGLEDGEYEREVKLFDSSYNEVEGMELDNVSVSVIGDYLAVYTDKDVTLYDENLKKLDFVYKRDDLQDPSETEELEPVLCDYTIYGVSGGYTYGDDKTYFDVYVELYYSNSTGENYYYDYETNMYDCDTFEKLSYEDVYDDSDDISNNITADVIYKDNKETYVREYYYNSELLYSDDNVFEYVVNEKSLENITNYYVYAIGLGDEICFAVNMESQDGPKDYAVFVTKDTGYSLDSAVIYDKLVAGAIEGKLGIIFFADSTIYFIGKFHDDSTTRLCMENDEIVLYAHKEGKEGEYTWKLYDIDDKVITEIPEEINYIADSGIILTEKCVENKEGDVKYYYGCYYLGKVLTSSDEILEELEKAEEGDSIEVKLDKNEPVKAEVLEEIKGKDIEIVVTTESGAKWSINGKDVKGTELKDIDLTVDIVEDVIPADAINEVEIKGDKIELTIAHTGEFGFDAKLMLNVKAENNGKYANLFYYNATSKKLEFQESAKVDANGDVVFDFSHASDYVIFISDAQYVEDTTDNTDNTDNTGNAGDSGNTTVLPDTGDASNAGFLMAVIVIAAGAFVLTQTKKATAK